MEETKIIYYIDDDKMPYLIKLNVAPDKATLKEFKNALNVNVKNYRYFFQTVDDDFGNVKEELMEDEHKLPNSNGRVICWLMTIEGSIAGSDTRSQNSLNTIEPVSRQGGDSGGNGGMEHQFSSMHSLSSTASSSVSNNENHDNRRLNYNQNNKHKNDLNYQNGGQIYDTLNNRKSNTNGKARHQQVAPLKDLNLDDTATETESLINAFDDMRMMHQNNRPSSSKHHTNTGSLAGSMKRTSKPHFSSFNNHQMNPNHKSNENGKQKLSLDSHHTNRTNYQMMGGHHPNNLNHHHNQYQNNYASGQHHVGLAVAKPKSKQQQHQLKGNKNDTFSDDDDDDDFDDESTNIGLTRTETGAAPSILSSDLDTTTFFDTENDDDDGQFSSITAETTNSTISSNKRYGQNRNRRKMRHKTHLSNLKGHNSLHSSISSLADSTMSLNIITVCLNMDSVNFLGISIVGQSNKGGEGGIYVGSIMSGGAVARDGRIEPGDMILQVNDISFENMSNDDAVKVLREAVMKPGPVKLVVAKCWDLSPKGYFTISKQEPVRPIDPSAWVAHTQAHTGMYGSGTNNYQNGALKGHHRLTHSISTFGSNSSLTSSIADSSLNSTYNNAVGYNGMGGNGNNLATTVTTTADSTRFGNEHLNLTVNTDMETVVRAMAATDSGLEVKDRNWLKITIPMAFLGSDVVEWLFNHVEGFPDRRDARKYACNMLKYGYIRHAVNKVRFSEQCYYIFGDFNQSTLNSQLFMNGGPGGNLFTLNEESEVDFDSVSELDRDTLYAPMNFPPPPVPGSAYNNLNMYQQHPKIYSNLNGIGGPVPPASYMSSSSSNATSNSTSTTSNNTTTQTIATTAIGGNGNNVSFNSTNNQNSTVNTNANKIYGGAIINTDRSNACQFYYPPLELTSFNNTTTNTCNMTATTASMFQQKNHNFDDSQEETIDQTTQQSQFTMTIDNTTMNNTNLFNQPPNSISSQSQYSSVNYQINNNQLVNKQQEIFQNYTIQSSYNNSGISNSSKHENKSIKSSDRDSSSGHGSDVELLSSSKSKSKKNRSQLFQFSSKSTSITQQQSVSVSNYYEIAQFNPPMSNSSINQIKPNGAPTSSTTSSTSSSSSSSSAQNNEQRTLDKIPRDLRLSKQSFHAAMGNPCEFFVDVM